jgi:cytochrome c-type biogenesis protein CcmH
MVMGMVDRLANRLRENGSDVEGWIRLMRSYVVLGERDKARAAASDARKALSSEPDKLQRIEDSLKELGLQG